MVLNLAFKVAFTAFVAYYYATDVVVKVIEYNPLSIIIEEFYEEITREELEHYKPKPGEVDVVENGKLKITTEDGKKKVLKIVEEITKKKSVLLLVELATFGTILASIDILTE